MFKIVSKHTYSPTVFKIEVEAPQIARKRQAGQFVVLRVNEQGERFPLTIYNADSEKGTLSLVFQTVGKSSAHLGTLNVGDQILDVVGPLGRPTHIAKYGTVVCIGGGIGTAPVYPIAQAMKQAGNKVISIIGARSKDLLILESEMREVSDEIVVCTDDGSYCTKGFTSDLLKSVINRGTTIDLVVTIGPVPMMKVICGITKEHKIKTMVSLNPLMVDATGMCGVCRVTVGGETKFGCVDGPEFDGHLVDFDELIKRLRIYLNQEKEAFERYKQLAHDKKCEQLAEEGRDRKTVNLL